MLFAEERYDLILSMLKRDGKVTVKNLSEQFEVTEDCIRKDLKLLENKNLLKRIYGGAVQIRVSPSDFEVVSRKQINVEGKMSIAQKAYNEIKNGETIFLDISTSNTYLVKLLLENNRKLTIVTNMLEIINILACPSNISAIAVGGMFNQTCDGFVGAATIDMISQYRFDRAFLGVVGIDVFENAVTDYETNDGYTKSAIIKYSKKKYLMVEEKKFQADANFKFAQLEEINTIVCDKLPNPEIGHALEKYKIKLL